ncbi:MAG TPA: exodeoxyribonuclease VII large subunit [Alphaproteobacteria bacterium]
MTDAPDLAGNVPEYTVSELSSALKRTVEGAFARVRVRGEISGYHAHGSGHLYFALKDESAVLDAVVWRTTAARLRVAPEDGLEVVCEGRLSTYAQRSKYQLVVDSIQVAGAGALLALVEERRRKLAAEGLFDAARKQPLPFLPEVIGVVTSPTGAVIRDILHRLADRFPRTVLVWPVRVQGEGAAEQVAAAIRGFNALPEGGAVPRPELLIVARGGGSIEDLWAFNEEVVVRAAAESRIPLISAVGHETDTTLIDFAADVRAPTPSAAAEMAVPVRAELAVTLRAHDHRLAAAAARLLRELGDRIEGLGRGLPRPEALLGEAGQRLDERAATLARVMGALIERRHAKLVGAAAGLRSPGERLAEARGRLAVAHRALAAAARTRLREARIGLDRALGEARIARALARLAGDRHKRLERAAALLETLGYRNVLARGFAVVYGADGALVPRAEAARRAHRLEIEFHDGRVGAQVLAPRSPAKRGAGDGGQGSLL